MIVIAVARKPLAEPTVAQNALKWGCGGINVDASRVALVDGESPRVGNPSRSDSEGYGSALWYRKGTTPTAGRWPANLILCTESAQELDEGASRFFKVIE